MDTYNGIINIFKEKDYTSHDAVAKLRGILKQKKIGHTGTLDPNAEGVLPICLGKATRLCDMLTDKDKVYETVMLLGTTTDTQDTTGSVISKIADLSNIDQKRVEEAIMSFVGEYSQVPPMYSALKVNGKKLYELAREGKVVERKARTVHIISIEILEISLESRIVKMRVECTKGTYIRTLCDDIGKKLGCGACMDELLRTKVSRFKVEDAIRLDDVRQYVTDGNVMEHIVPIDEMFLEYPRIDVCEDDMKGLSNGNILNIVDERVTYGDLKEASSSNWFRVYDTHSRFCAIYEKVDDSQKYKPVKMFI